MLGFALKRKLPLTLRRGDMLKSGVLVCPCLRFGLKYRVVLPLLISVFVRHLIHQPEKTCIEAQIASLRKSRNFT